MTPTRVHRFIDAEPSLIATPRSLKKFRNGEGNNIRRIHASENAIRGKNWAAEKSVQCVPNIDDISERVVEGCESTDDIYVPIARSFKNLPLASSTMIQKPLVSSTTLQRNASSRVSRRSSKPCASSTMIEDTTLDTTITNPSAPSVYTWSLDESSELLFVEDSYMRKTEKKIVSVFGKAGRDRDAFCGGILSSGDETIKYEDGGMSDSSNTGSMLFSESLFGNMSSENTVEFKKPLMSSTRYDFHQVPQYSYGTSGNGIKQLQKIPERPDIPGDEDPDASRVTPDNPSITATCSMKKPAKVNKFAERFKLRRVKGITSLNTMKEHDSSPAKRELFLDPCIKDKKPKGGSGKANVIRKLKTIGESFRSQGRQFQTLAVL
ncbi:hypothetical protein FSP39_015342 [Pinctada imbricata]|uniref:Uncharacterized protein n=1 Tax=Pinctada imbricata TaxID=66713 RepID=A0AA88XHC4_PINIB|nr:hypothetical protein FSP39_015342 [Pinctada imbricata]